LRYESHQAAVSYRLTSTSSPRPVRSRVRSAAWIPMAAHNAVPRSMAATPSRAGGPSGCPVTDMIPLSACSTGSYPGQSCFGPRGPKALIEQ